MMATLIATAAVASSSVAIRPFRSHKPSCTPAGIRCSVAEGPAISQPRAAGGDWLIAWWSGAGSAGSASPRRSPRSTATGPPTWSSPRPGTASAATSPPSRGTATCGRKASIVFSHSEIGTFPFRD
ncbi:hypothetical protein NL676_039682 [Syzygium grande]|nr:hypothetical protein NL676_039682 [Syzygium grande]